MLAQRTNATKHLAMGALAPELTALLPQERRLALPHSVWLSGFPQVDMLGFWYKFVNFGAGKNPGPPH